MPEITHHSGHSDWIDLELVEDERKGVKATGSHCGTLQRLRPSDQMISKSYGREPAEEEPRSAFGGRTRIRPATVLPTFHGVTRRVRTHKVLSCTRDQVHENDRPPRHRFNTCLMNSRSLNWIGPERDFDRLHIDRRPR